ncbi:MAG: MBL fold metallo-hydrolase [bacterium]|nr:MBL fold metallo-hydrolase [bacterium]
MNIQYYGDYCFKISTKPAGRATEDVIIWTNPLGKGAGLRGPQGQVDLILESHTDEKNEKEVSQEELTLDTPGEYAVKGMALVGLPSFRDSKAGAERGQNTIFLIESEELRLVFLGGLGSEPLPDVLDALSEVDILFAPAGGKDTLEPKALAELVRKVEPKIVIPMHYKMEGLSLPLETEKAFLTALGSKAVEKVAKLNIKKKDVEGKSLEVVLFERGL